MIPGKEEDRFEGDGLDIWQSELVLNEAPK